ncbi:hypothetical protein F4802DRAFT_601606 [Xylaria palmicola]|nr:hypothetical protein F4802DRAFT_601606 [Xylaria palmicola]
MSYTNFQKYVEGMNRQPLDKKPERRGSGILLPHQRTTPIKKQPVANQESGLQTPKKECNRQIGADTPQQDVHAGVSKLSATLHPPRRVILGLAQSRWADLGRHGTSAHEYTWSPSRSSIHRPDQERATGEKKITTPSSKKADEPQRGILAMKQIKLDGNGTPSPALGLDTQDTSNHNSRPSSSTGVTSMRGTGWSELGDNENKVSELGRHRPTAGPKVSATEGGSMRSTAPLPQVEASKVHEQTHDDPLRDPRGNWPAEPQDADEARIPRDQKGSSDAVSFSTDGDKVIPQLMNEFIETWLRDAHVVNADFLSQKTEHHETCDVDTVTGNLMEPVDYPRTIPGELMTQARAEGSSAQCMRLFEAETARRDPVRKAQRKAEREARAAAQASLAAAAPVVEEPPNPYEVQIPCHIRPADEPDIKAITAIYNQEIETGYKVMDTQPVKQDDIFMIYHQCLAEKMPFVVAVEGWHGRGDQLCQGVIGFGMVTAVGRGITGSYETLASRGGKLVVIVKPEYRRKKIGTALTDILITNCTGWYLPKGGYQFVNLTNHGLSNQFRDNQRKWWYLEMEVMIVSGADEEKTRKGEEFQWIWNFLEAKFDLLLKHYDEKCFYEPRQMKWLDKLTFRRRCRSARE